MFKVHDKGKWSLTCSKCILEISHSNYLQFCSNLPVRFAIFLRSSLLFNNSYPVVFSVYKQNFMAENLKTRTAMNAKISVFVICVEVICYYIICMAVPSM